MINAPPTLPPYLSTGALIIGRKGQPQTSEPIGFAPYSGPKAPRSAGELMTYAGDGHLITFAPTGAGKTTGPIIANALTHPGQLIVLDIKGDVYKATAAARRALGQRVYVIDMRDGRPSDTLNPLDMAALGGADIPVIARSLAADIVAPTGNEREAFWTQWAETLIGGGVMWAMTSVKPEEQNIGAFFDMLTSEDPEYKLINTLGTGTPLPKAGQAAFKSFVALSDRDTRPNVLACALAPLRLFDSDLVRTLTDSTTIDLAALVAGEPISLYIIVPPARLPAYRPLLRLWLTGLLNALTHRMEVPKHRTLMLVDEAGNLGRMEALLTAYTLLRGYGMTIWTFWQNVGQLALYGDQARTILDNAGVVQLFGARNRRMAEEFVQLVGGTDADSIMAMPRDEQLVLIEGATLERCRRIRYFEDTEFEGLYEALSSPSL